jgi:hypothetical protein
MDVIVETNVLGWLDCLALVGAIASTVAASRAALTSGKSGLTLIPTGWFGVALGVDALVVALAFVHGSVPMIARLAQRADQTGLYVGTVALLLACAQVLAAWLAPAFLRSRWLARVCIGNVVLIGLLMLWHVVLNGGNLAALPAA